MTDWGPCSGVVSLPEVEAQETGGAGGLEITPPELGAP